MDCMRDRSTTVFSVKRGALDVSVCFGGDGPERHGCVEASLLSTTSRARAFDARANDGKDERGVQVPNSLTVAKAKGSRNMVYHEWLGQP